MPQAMPQASDPQCQPTAQRNARTDGRTDGRTNGLTHAHSPNAESLNKRYARRGAERIHPLSLTNRR